MLLQLTDDQRQAIEELGGGPVYIVDPNTNAHYVLMRAEDYEKMKAPSEDDDDVSSMYPLLADLAPEDWEDASNYERRP
jgi:hypothetical protein